MLKKQKPPQRNITPNFIVMKNSSRPKLARNANKLYINNEKCEDVHQPTRTDRSSSRNSKCSFGTYERRVLHLSKLKSNLAGKKKQQSPTEVMKGVQVNNKTFDGKRNNSNPKDLIGRENYAYGGRRSGQCDSSLSRKRISGSGKIILRASSRSNSKRDEDSLEKEEQRAKLMNFDLIASLNKHSPTPNYIHQLKMKKNNERDPRQRKKETIRQPQQNYHHRLLKLDIEIKGPQAIQEYDVYGELGKGAYGIVRMGIHKKSGQKVAIKFYHKKHLEELNRLNNLEREINILANLDHPVIAKLIEAIQTPSQIFLVLEYGGANSLYNYLLSKHEHRLKESEAKKFLEITAQTINYLHQKNIVHRDIKAENILINRYKELKLIDFGFSIHSVPPSTIDTFCGTPTYMAPEIVSKLDHVPIYTDMWSLGILYFVMLQGNYPFRSKNEEDLFDKIRRGKFEYIHDDVSQASKDLIASLLQVDPYRRLTITEVLSEKYYQFFASGKLEEAET